MGDSEVERTIFIDDIHWSEAPVMGMAPAPEPELMLPQPSTIGMHPVAIWVMARQMGLPTSRAKPEARLHWGTATTTYTRRKRLGGCFGNTQMELGCR